MKFVIEMKMINDDGDLTKTKKTTDSYDHIPYVIMEVFLAMDFARNTATLAKVVTEMCDWEKCNFSEEALEFLQGARKLVDYWSDYDRKHNPKL